VTTLAAPGGVRYEDRSGLVRELKGPRFALPIAWVATRVVMFLLVSTPNAVNRLLPDLVANGDVAGVYYHAYRLMHAGQLPYNGFAYEYPPGTLLPLLALPRGLSPTTFLFIWELEMVLLDGLVLWAIVLLGRLAGARQATVRSAAWAWVVGGMVMSGLFLVRNDLLACALVAWAAVFLYSRRPALAGLCLGLGTVTKLWPALILVLLLVGLRRDRLRMAAGAAVTFIITGIALATTGTLGACVDYVTKYHGRRPLEVEALAARPVQLVAAFSGRRAPVENTYGSYNLLGYHALVTASSIASLAVLVATLLIVRRHGTTTPSLNLLSIATVSLIASSLVTAKVFSPQYVSWLLVVAVCAGAVGALPRQWLWTAVAVVALTGAEYPLGFGDLLRGNPTMTVIVLFRDLVLITLAVGTAVLAIRRRREESLPAT